MILLIGGVFRTGKSILARRLMLATSKPYLGLDVLKMALVSAAPGYPVDPDRPTRDVALALWPLVRALCVAMIEQHDPYIVEGEIAPAHAAELIASYPGAVRACFLGYPRIEAAQKLAEIRAHGGHANDWPSECSDEYMMPLVFDMIAHSAVLERECAEHGVPFFDTSTELPAVLDRAAASLTAAT